MKQRSAWTIDSLRQHLQGAVELELYTIPLYITTLYSLRDEWSYAHQLCRSVVVEEMLHMQLAANVLAAIGGRPVMTGDSVPLYPSLLPYHKPPTTFHLRAASVRQFSDLALVEKPDETSDEESKARRTGPAPGWEEGPHKAYLSIGDFYQSIVYGLEALGDDIFVANTEPQVTAFGRHDILVDSVESAKRAIHVIVSQGEGSMDLDGMNDIDTDLDDRPSHYKRFLDVVAAGDEQFQDNRVFPMADDPASHGLPEDVAALSDFADAVYSRLLFQLERGFNGSPSTVARSVGGMMYQAIRPLSVLLMKQPIAADPSQTAGPRFLWVDGVTLDSLQAQWEALKPEYRAELKGLDAVIRQQI